MKHLLTLALLACMAISAPAAPGHAPSASDQATVEAQTTSGSLSLNAVGCCDQGYEIKSAVGCCDQGYEIKAMSGTTRAMVAVVAFALLALAFIQHHHRNASARWT